MIIKLLVLNPFTNDPRVHKEAKTLASAGHQVTVIALWKSGLPEEEVKANYQVIRIRLRSQRWGGGFLAPVAKYLEYAARVWGLEGNHRTHIFHANDANTLPAAWLATKRGAAQLVYDAHELETGREFHTPHLSPIYQKVWSWPERALIHKAAAVITVSDGIAGELSRLYKISPPIVIRNCPEFLPVSPVPRLREELAIPPEQKIAIYQGNISPGRGIEPFLEAVQSLPELAGIVLGEGPLLSTLRQQQLAGKWQRVHLLGGVPMDQVPQFIACADIGVVLTQNICRSYYLSLPNKLFEYIHSGLPVIASHLPEIARIVREYQVGELVNPQDPAEIAAGMRRLLDDPTFYARIQSNTRAAASILNWEVESKKLLALYQQLEVKV